MKCEKCRNEIDSLDINVFNYDGSDNFVKIPLQECEENAVFVDTSQNWTGYELSDDERLETIRCPYCNKFPFKNSEVQIYNIVRVVCFKMM